jgi:hypothetical protein
MHRSTSKKIPDPPELRGDMSSIPAEVLPPEKVKEYNLALIQIIARKNLETQYVALRGALKTAEPSAKRTLPGKIKPGPDSVEELSHSIFARLYPNGPGRERWKVIRSRVKEVMEKDHGILIDVRSLVRHGITKKGIAKR